MNFVESNSHKSTDRKEPEIAEINISSECNQSNKEVVCFAKTSSFKFNFSNPTAESICTAVLLFPQSFKEDNPLKAVRGNRAFTLEVFDRDNIMCDDNGTYVRTKNVKRYFHIEINEDGKTFKAQSVHGKAPDFFIKVRRSSRNYTNVNIPLNQVYLLERTYRDSKSFHGLKHITAIVKGWTRNNMRSTLLWYTAHLR